MEGKKILEDIVSAPAEALDKGMEESGKFVENLPGKKIIQKGKDYWHMLGPGLTTGVADDDPSGIFTYSQTGAQYGFSLLWLAIFTFPLMGVVQEMCARIGLVTGKGLAANIREHFPRSVLYTTALLLFAANSFNIGADLGAMAKGTQLLLPGLGFNPLIIAWALICVLLQIFMSYGKYAKFLKWVALLILSYAVSALLSHLDWHQVLLAGVIPHLTFSRDQIILICGILGTTISPYLFFWQTSQEVEEEFLDGKTTLAQRRVTSDEDVKNMRIDNWSGMFLSQAAMFFIIAACGGILFTHGVTNIASASQAAEALRPFAGNYVYFLFTIGILGVGILGIPVLAGSASYAISESFKWKEGLYRPLKKAYSFYGIIIISMLVGLGMNFVGLDPIKALIYSAVGNGLVAPVVLVLIVLLARNKKVMGERSNKPFTTAIGWIAAGVMIIAGIATLYSLFF